MFGFVRRTKVNWEQKVEGMRAPVVDELSTLLVHVTYRNAVAHGFKEGDANTKTLMDIQGKIVMGFEAFRMGCDPREVSDPLIKCAVALAQVSCNDVILKGAINQNKTSGELTKLLGFS
jgi:hypothetical protein